MPPAPMGQDFVPTEANKGGRGHRTIIPLEIVSKLACRLASKVWALPGVSRQAALIPDGPSGSSLGEYRCPSEPSLQFNASKSDLFVSFRRSRLWLGRLPTPRPGLGSRYDVLSEASAGDFANSFRIADHPFSIRLSTSKRGEECAKRGTTLRTTFIFESRA